MNEEERREMCSKLAKILFESDEDLLVLHNKKDSDRLNEAISSSEYAKTLGNVNYDDAFKIVPTINSCLINYRSERYKKKVPVGSAS